MRNRSLWVALSTIGAVGLVVILFSYAGATGADVWRAMSGAPLWMYAALTMLTGANKLVGAAKWRVAATWLTPDTPPPGFLSRVELTALGSFFGQLLPIQLATAAVRAIEARRRSGAGAAIRATLYEQVFDLVALLVFAVAGGAILLLSPSTGSVLLILIAVLASVISGFWFLCRVAASLCRTIGGRFFGEAADAFAKAGAAPPGVVTSLLGWSTVRVALTAARFAVAVAVFAPAAPVLLATAGYPFLGLAIAFPIFPAGLGIAEWTTSGLLVFLGATAATAAVCALASRIVNLISLIFVLAALLALRVLAVARG